MEEDSTASDGDQRQIVGGRMSPRNRGREDIDRNQTNANLIKSPDASNLETFCNIFKRLLNFPNSLIVYGQCVKRKWELRRAERSEAARRELSVESRSEANAIDDRRRKEKDGNGIRIGDRIERHDILGQPRNDSS
nr:hypothetical protein Iba_chr11cCG1420 [Ipomoea batatas]